MKALYAGSFDPWTRGHEDILLQALQVFDEIEVLVCENPLKKHAFSVEQRINIIDGNGYPRINIKVLDSTYPTVLKAKELQCTHMIRGLRSITDFEYEIQLANMNSRIDCSINTIYFTPELSNQYVSSSMVREFLRLGQNLCSLVPTSSKYKIEQYWSMK